MPKRLITLNSWSLVWLKSINRWCVVSTYKCENLVCCGFFWHETTKAYSLSSYTHVCLMEGAFDKLVEIVIGSITNFFLEFWRDALGTCDFFLSVINSPWSLLQCDVVVVKPFRADWHSYGTSLTILYPSLVLLKSTLLL